MSCRDLQRPFLWWPPPGTLPALRKLPQHPLKRWCLKRRLPRRSQLSPPNLIHPLVHRERPLMLLWKERLKRKAKLLPNLCFNLLLPLHTGPKVIITSGLNTPLLQLPPSELSCFAGPPTKPSLWGLGLDIKALLPQDFIPQHDRGLLLSAEVENSIDMMAAYHICSLATLKV
ncbi:hypothetical protein CR513_45387, partial [Mucuna pruriens]